MVQPPAHPQPLTPTLFPEGRGGDGAGEPPITSPLRGEVGPQDRVRGRKLQPAQVVRARALRGQPTQAEHRLWRHLRNRALDGQKFVRQYAIGPYVTDFACRDAMLVIEVDGGQHAGSAHDAIRTRQLNALGYSVLRLWNQDVLSDTPGVLDAIHRVLIGNPSPDLRFAPATLSPEGRGNDAPPPGPTRSA